MAINENNAAGDDRCRDRFIFFGTIGSNGTNEDMELF